MHISTQAHLNARIVSRNLEEAICCFEVFAPSGSDKALIDSINRHMLNPAFNAISSALHNVALVCLSRIWDKRHDVASIGHLRKHLNNKELFARNSTEMKLFDRRDLERWAAAVDGIQRSDELKAVVAARNMFIAHSRAAEVPYMGNARPLTYGDERGLIEATIPIVAEANRMIGYTFLNFEDLKARWKAESRKYWSSADGRKMAILGD